MKKFLSLILALTLVASLCAVNVMAAAKVHTVGLSASKTEALTAGETIVVEVTIDNTLNLVNVDYDLVYDADAFEVNLTKVSRLETFIDKTWYDGLKDTDGDWGYYMNGAPTINGNEAGVIYFRAAGGANGGVEDEYDVDNRVIGKYNLNVKADAPDGTYEIKVINGKTGDAGETQPAAMEPVAITVKVGTPGPVGPVVEKTEAIADNGITIDGVTYDNAFGVNATITPTDEATEIGVLFAPALWLSEIGAEQLTVGLEGAKNVSKTGLVGGTAVTFKAAIKDIPRGLTGESFDMVTRAYAKDDEAVTYADALTTAVLFSNTGK
ncbi:MAG: hypothetical protein E7415_01170 [Ruminococcaceae bacterium]|nr:hypothetical protein [Oscillospiraceae bacterium]